MPARCPKVYGAGDSLGCCRVADHAGSCCRHWSARLYGTPPHTLVYRASYPHPLACVRGRDLDAAAEQP